MIKAYFFDWMKTLGSVIDVIDFKAYLTREEHEVLLVTERFEDLKLSNGKRELIYDALQRAEFSLFDDSEETIENLRANRLKLAVISNIYSTTPQRLRELYGSFLCNFDVVTFSSEVGMRKPDERIFNYTLDRLNEMNGSQIYPKEVMMIGDNEKNDIIPALALGMQAGLIDRSKQNLGDVLK